jgi:hypothetical protein
MASATFEDHPTDPDKVILRKKPYLDKGRDYEEGFVDGMQHQMQSSVDKAVNRMAQPEQEPVAWMLEGWGPDCGPYFEIYRDDEMGWRNKKEWTPLYTTPPQRTWVGLTDEEIADCAEKMEASDPTDSFWREFFRGIEAKLKDKNT